MSDTDLGSGSRSVDLSTMSIDRLQPCLRELVGHEFDVRSAIRLTAGASNTMYVLTAADGAELVLRVPPAVKTSRSAHDINREFRIMSALRDTTVPHARLHGLCEDESILGAPFMVMEKVDGFHLELPMQESVELRPERVRAMSTAFVDGLANIASVDWRAAGLEGFGRPDGFLSRQVNRWLSQLAGYRERELPYLDVITTWLDSNRPPDAEPAIMHGDYQFLNVMFGRSDPEKIVAVVDWEQSTIGDPMLDLGWVLGLWCEAGERSAVSGDDTWITQIDGMPTRTEIAERYATVSGRDVGALAYYEVLGLFKLACILEGSYVKSVRNESDIDRHKHFGVVVPRLLEDAAAIIHGERS
ncbi:phosphotransferase family protein [Rhodococcus opacus]|uniref:Phosphotransferase family protein n=1 Tax=Rhodococcus opacus TaxID=37919 RepID=A0A2S8J4X3_RHOOP|nr:phosphotransferase family protein [Rhodococcus opacus]PQP21979.1 phosphotransferase family protein [Rhodococcus opacus]